MTKNLTNILHSATQVRLLRSAMPAGKSWYDVPDALLDSDQKSTIAAAQKLIGVKGEASTFCIGVKDTGERIIVQPKLVQGTAGLGIRWGKNTYPLTLKITQSSVTEIVYATIATDEGGYLFPVAFMGTEDIPANATSAQKKLRAAGNDAHKRAALVTELSAKELNTILRLPGSGFVKLVDLSEGKYPIVGYEASTSPYGLRYKLTMADGRKLDDNTAIRRVCTEWDALDIEVSPNKPAELVVAGRSLTKDGKTVVSTALFSSRELEYELFDFSQETRTASNGLPSEDDDLT